MPSNAAPVDAGSDLITQPLDETAPTPTEAGDTAKATPTPEKQAKSPRPSRLARGLSSLMTGLPVTVQSPPAPTPVVHEAPPTKSDDIAAADALSELALDAEQPLPITSANDDESDDTDDSPRLLWAPADEAEDESDADNPSVLAAILDSEPDHAVAERLTLLDDTDRPASAIAAALAAASEDIDDDEADADEHVRHRHDRDHASDAHEHPSSERRGDIAQRLTRAIEMPMRSAHLQLARATFQSRVAFAAAAVAVAAMIVVTFWSSHALSSAQEEVRQAKDDLTRHRLSTKDLEQQVISQSAQIAELARQRDAMRDELASNERALDMANTTIDTLQTARR